MRFRGGAQLDTSQVSDRRGAGPMLIGGGGLVGVILLVIQLLGGGIGGGGRGTPSLGQLDTDLSAECIPARTPTSRTTAGSSPS